MFNETMTKFGYPNTLVQDYEHWVLLLRPLQVTLGSLVLAAKSNVGAFGKLPAGAHAELSTITAQTEAMLTRHFGYDRINYLMLMMVDPHVHFHIFPRYETSRTFAHEEYVDAGWPGPPDLKSGRTLIPATLAQLRSLLSSDSN